MPNPPPPPPDNDSRPPPPSAESRTAALRAILAGVSVDICGSVLLGFVIKTAYALQVSTPEMTPSQIEDAVRNIPNQSPLMVLGNLLGSLLSVGAGYVCARIARRDEFRTGALMAGCTTLVTLLVADTSRDPFELTLLFISCSVACAMLGVMYGARQNRRMLAPANPSADTTTP